MDHHFLILGKGRSTDWDIVKNIFLFLPLGFGLTGFLTQKTRLGVLAVLTVLLFASLRLSHTSEKSKGGYGVATNSNAPISEVAPWGLEIPS